MEAINFLQVLYLFLLMDVVIFILWQTLPCKYSRIPFTGNSLAMKLFISVQVLLEAKLRVGYSNYSTAHSVQASEQKSGKEIIN